VCRGGGIILAAALLLNPIEARSETHYITPSPADVTLNEILEGFEIDEVEVPADAMPFLAFVTEHDPNSLEVEVTQNGGVTMLIGPAEINVETLVLDDDAIEYCGSVTTPGYEGELSGSVYVMGASEIASIEFLSSEVALLETNPTAFVRMTFNHDAISGELTTAPCSLITTFAPHSELATQFQSLPLAFILPVPPEPPPVQPAWPGDDGMIIWTGVRHYTCDCYVNGTPEKLCPGGRIDCEDSKTCSGNTGPGECNETQHDDECSTPIAYVGFTLMALGMVRWGRTRSGSV
jgi:hypothetical protein